MSQPQHFPPPYTVEEIHEPGGTDTPRVKKRVEDWKKRLAELFARVDEWCSEIDPEYETEQFQVDQSPEEMLKRFDVEPGKLPAWRARKGKRTIEFLPGALWVVGARGMVNVITPEFCYTLVDANRSGGAGSDWRIESRSHKLGLRPLTRDVLGLLLSGKQV